MGSRVSVLNHGLGIVPDLDAHTKNRFAILATGQYISPGNGALAAAAMTANRLYACPVIIVRTMTLDRIAVFVGVGALGKSARLGIYANTDGLTPGALSLDAGEVSVAGTGVAAVTTSTQLTKGIYWLVVVSDGTPSVCGVHWVGNLLLGFGATWNTQMNVGYYVALTYGALPATFGTGTLSTYDIAPPLVCIRILSLD